MNHVWTITGLRGMDEILRVEQIRFYLYCLVGRLYRLLELLPGLNHPALNQSPHLALDHREGGMRDRWYGGECYSFGHNSHIRGCRSA